jgi:hypothetical protein
MIERDDNIPPLDRTDRRSDRTRAMAEQVLGPAAR